MSAAPMSGVMGVLNVTPDSFSDGGQFPGTDAAVDHGRALFSDGADLVDVGGESTRPGAEPVPADVESARVLPVITALAAHGIPVSVDTMKADVASAALDAGAVAVNDVSAGTRDDEMLAVIAAADATVVLMHMQGNPATMQIDPQYADVVADVGDALCARADAARQAGISDAKILVDPGIGFGKTPAHNLSLLARLDELVQRVDHPVLVGPSRKSFIGSTLDLPVGDRDDATLATVVWALERGASMVRVHDARAARRAADLIVALRAASDESVRGAA